MFTNTDGAVLSVDKISHSKADIQQYFPARSETFSQDFIKMAQQWASDCSFFYNYTPMSDINEVVPYKYFSVIVVDHLSPVQIKILV